MDSMTLRNYLQADAEALAEIYRDAALNLGRKGYTEEQVAVWARHPEDLEQFRAMLSEGLTLCAEADGAPVAFGQLHPPDHIAYLYCHSAHARHGHAARILARLEDHAASQGVVTLRVEASRVARPFFQRAGYRVIAEERPVRHGVEFVRFVMEKELAERPDFPPDT
jgi:putative acetyltransferase